MMEMFESELKDDDISSAWQKVQIASCVSKTPQHQASALRSLLAQVQYSHSTKKISSVGSADLMQSLSSDYAQLMDSPEEQAGLNNCASSILQLIGRKKTESQAWTSSLRIENSRTDLPKYFSHCKASDDSVISPECATASINLEQFREIPSEQQYEKPSTSRDSSNLKRESISDRLSSISGSTYSAGQQKRSFSHVDKSEDENVPSSKAAFSFRTAKQQLSIDNNKKNGHQSTSSSTPPVYGGNTKKSLGTRRGPASKFVPPIMNRNSDDNDSDVLMRKADVKYNDDVDEVVDERLKNIDPNMVKLITNEIMDHGPAMTWDDIAGLEFAKNTIKEIVVWPLLRPDIFTGLRGPPKGLLLFGPPGTGKTLIGKCIASQSKSTFFSISASSLTSKWVGEGEKMVRALFAVARVHQPAVVFMDEIDSLLTKRSDGEHESSRRIKTEFLVQLDGASTDSNDRILIIGATNRPQEIDDAARRRFVKRLYIPLPEQAARRHIVTTLLKQQSHNLTEQDYDAICAQTEGYSGADMSSLCREAALGPIRSIAFNEIETISTDQVRPMSFKDFQEALKHVRATVSVSDLDVYLSWNDLYGSWPPSSH